MTSSSNEFYCDENDNDTSDYDDYYQMSDLENEIDYLQGSAKDNDLEHFEYECLPAQKVAKLWSNTVELLCKNLNISPSKAKVLLYQYKWDLEKIKEKENARDTSNGESTCQTDSGFYSDGPHDPLICTEDSMSANISCMICFESLFPSECVGLSCGHRFCKECWNCYIETQVSLGASIGIECMSSKCHDLVPEDFALENLQDVSLREKYEKFAFIEYVTSHPELRFCPGLNCDIVIRAHINKPKRVICEKCETTFCYRCGSEYHPPTPCSIIKKWLTKCADDSETSNYLSVHTKDCPSCHACIEKNGGCNHIHCFTCKHDFCWLCMCDWREHGANNYQCSKYIDSESEPSLTLAREALKKYLFYYERWANHAQSLKLEEQTLNKIRDKITREVMSNNGTWIDWQYLLDAAALLAKCRYTLQYTYPYAYYMETGLRKQLFEYQQAQLEAEIEDLSWKLERAETTDRGELENQMDVTEKRRTTLLKDFFAD